MRKEVKFLGSSAIHENREDRFIGFRRINLRSVQPFFCLYSFFPKGEPHTFYPVLFLQFQN